MDPINEAIPVIKRFEALRLKAYQDARGKWTVGYGATGMFITSQTTWTEDQANNDLYQRVEAIYGVLKRGIVPSLTGGQWGAIISLAYNIGVSALTGSTLIRLLNERDFEGAAEEFPKWDKITIAGQLQESQGLLSRRLQEQALFRS